MEINKRRGTGVAGAIHWRDTLGRTITYMALHTRRRINLNSSYTYEQNTDAPVPRSECNLDSPRGKWFDLNLDLTPKVGTFLLNVRIFDKGLLKLKKPGKIL